MSFLASFRSDQILSQLIAEQDAASPSAQKLVDKLKKAGNRAVPKIIDALALSDKTHTMVLVDILGELVNDKNLNMYREGLADGNERVVSGTAWALSSSTDYNPNSLLDFFDDDEVSKAALIDVLRVHKQDLSVHELLRRAYECETKEKAAIFRIIEEIIKPEMVPDLIARMGGKDPVIKMHLMNLLAQFDKPEINHALEIQLKDPNKMVRGAALNALAARGNDIHIERVSELLRDPDLDVQNKAVDVMIRINHPETIKYLADALKDDSEYSRRAAVEVLNEIVKGEEVFSNVGKVAAESSLVRFLSAKDDGRAKRLVWGILTDDQGRLHITLRDFRPHVVPLLQNGYDDLAQMLAKDYVESYSATLSNLAGHLAEISLAEDVMKWE